MRASWFLVMALTGLGLGAACAASSTDDGRDTEIRPQPQPNRREALFSAPCTATTCGDAPASLSKPRCAPSGVECTWAEDAVVSYAQCDAGTCGQEPSPDVCPAGTDFKANMCGSENEGACRWTTVCAPPPSTTPCADPSGCGAQPALGVICSDGGMGELLCMQLDDRCGWQRSCD
jgi:hypothetical protein